MAVGEYLAGAGFVVEWWHQQRSSTMTLPIDQFGILDNSVADAFFANMTDEDANFDF